MIACYDWAGGREAIMRFGPDDGPVVILALPPLEEANRLRTFSVGIARQLAGCGIASVLPDLPGTGESLLPTYRATLTDWRAAFAAAAAFAGARHGAAIRAGALIDTAAILNSRWHFAPQSGSALVRELERTRKAAEIYDREKESPSNYIEISGNSLSRALIDELSAAVPSPARTLRLEGDGLPADQLVAGAPLWRRAEPGDDPALAAALAADIAAWVRRCDG